MTDQRSDDVQAQIDALRRSVDALRSTVKTVDAAGYAGATEATSLRRLLAGGAASVSVLLMLLGLLLPTFIPFDGEGSAKNLLQAVDGSSRAAVWDGQTDPGGGWLIPIICTLLCAVFVIAAGMSSPPWVATATQLLCTLLIVGCFLGFMMLGVERSGVRAFPESLVAIIIGSATGIVAARLARDMVRAE